MIPLELSLNDALNALVDGRLHEIDPRFLNHGKLNRPLAIAMLAMELEYWQMMMELEGAR